VPGGAGIWVLAQTLEADEPGIMVCAALALALIAVVLIPACQAALETRVQRAFFPEHYDYRRKLRELAAALVHILDREQLVKRLGDALTDVLDVEGCDIFLADEDTARLARAYPAAQGGQPMPEPLVRALEPLREPILAAELEAMDAAGAAVFRASAWEVGIPLRIKNRPTGLIAHLLALGKSKTAERRPVELGPTLEPVVRLMESTARKRQIEVVATFDPRVRPVWADPDQLKQITVNLLLNAIETSAPGGHAW